MLIYIYLVILLYDYIASLLTVLVQRGKEAIRHVGNLVQNQSPPTRKLVGEPSRSAKLSLQGFGSHTSGGQSILDVLNLDLDRTVKGLGMACCSKPSWC